MIVIPKVCKHLKKSGFFISPSDLWMKQTFGLLRGNRKSSLELSVETFYPVKRGGEYCQQCLGSAMKCWLGVLWLRTCSLQPLCYRAHAPDPLPQETSEGVAHVPGQVHVCPCSQAKLPSGNTSCSGSFATGVNCPPPNVEKLFL